MAYFLKAIRGTGVSVSHEGIEKSRLRRERNVIKKNQESERNLASSSVDSNDDHEPKNYQNQSKSSFDKKSTNSSDRHNNEQSNEFIHKGSVVARSTGEKCVLDKYLNSVQNVESKTCKSANHTSSNNHQAQAVRCESSSSESFAELSNSVSCDRYVEQPPDTGNDFVEDKYRNFRICIRRSSDLQTSDSAIKCSNEFSNILPETVLNRNVEKDLNIFPSYAPSAAVLNSNLKNCKALTESDAVNYSLKSHMKSITEYIQSEIEEYSSTFIVYKVINELNIFFKRNIPGNTVDLYGSYFFNAASSLSDINLYIKTEAGFKKGVLKTVYTALSKEIKGYEVMPFEESDKNCDHKITLYEPYDRIMCNIVYLEKNETNMIKRNHLLQKLCSFDERVKTLIIVCKIWASVCNLIDVEEGKLNSFGFTLMAIHFLQRYSKPILPVINMDNLSELRPFSAVNVSMGELWLEFLKYFSCFNWDMNIVSITSELVSKQSKKGVISDWIVIEDPFTRRNVAKSVETIDSANYIKACFKSAFKHFSNHCTDKDETSESSSDEPDFQYSFRSSIDSYVSYNENDHTTNNIQDICEKTNSLPDITKIVENVSDEVLKNIKTVLKEVNEKYALTPSELRDRKSFVVKLEQIIRNKYQDARLELFGSSASGFGFKNSDLDICLTFQDKSYKDLKRDVKPILFFIRNMLIKDKDYADVYAIVNAQVPIVKFFYKPNKWKGDISLYNILAVRNTKLLYTYSIVDERCAHIGRAFKLLAKKAFINEATTRCLSSYSLILMVIHFLQQIEPPVLPVLQSPELCKGARLADFIDDCNTYFCCDMDIIEHYKNTLINGTPVENLWLDLLDFYCKYDKRRCITIRQKEPLYQENALLSSRTFNIQDPFITHKNLGRIVDGTKAREIDNVFKRSRNLFRMKSNKENLCDFYFASMNLTGRYIEEKECTMCGKFDHTQKQCRIQSYSFRTKFSQHSPIKGIIK